MLKAKKVGQIVCTPLNLAVLLLVMSGVSDYLDKDMQAGFFMVASAVMYAAYYIGERIDG